MARRMFVILASAILSVCIVPSDSFADMIGTLFKQKAITNTGTSKIKFKRKLHKADGDGLTFAEIAPYLGLNISIDLTNGNGDTLSKSITGNWLCTIAPSGKAKCLLDTGDCQAKYSLKFHGNDGSYTGALSVKCVVPWPVSTTDNVEIDFSNPSSPFVVTHDICFLNAAFGYTNAAVVKKDGSDGKSVKMLNAPINACEDG